jgi:hypothetical protein
MSTVFSGTDVGTNSGSYALRFREGQKGLHVPRAIDWLEGADALLWAAIATEDLRRSWPGDQLITKGSLQIALESAWQVSEFTVIRRLSYNSPLEIVLSASLAAGSFVAVGNRLINMYNNFLDARAKAAETETKRLAHRVIQQGLLHRLSENDAVNPPPPFTAADVGAIDKAAQALAAIDSVKILESES